MLFSDKCKSRLRRVFHVNMLLGSAAFAVAVYLIITGTYDNLTARQQAELLLNRVAIGGLLMLVLSWSADVLGRPYLCPSQEQQG